MRRCTGAGRGGRVRCIHKRRVIVVARQSTPREHAWTKPDHSARTTKVSSEPPLCYCARTCSTTQRTSLSHGTPVYPGINKPLTLSHRRLSHNTADCSQFFLPVVHARTLHGYEVRRQAAALSSSPHLQIYQEHHHRRLRRCSTLGRTAISSAPSRSARCGWTTADTGTGAAAAG